MSKTAVAVLCVFSLYACGGGGGGDGGSSGLGSGSGSGTSTGSGAGGVQQSSPALAAPVVKQDGETIGTATFAAGASATGGQGQAVQGLSCSKPTQSLQPYTYTHLNLLVDGQPVAVPQDIGLVPQGNAGISDPELQKIGCYYPVVTTDASGKIRMRSGSTINYTLGQFFALWGQPLERANIAGLSGKPVKVFIKDGATFAEYTGDLQTLALTPNREITIQVGSAPSEIPNYQWNDPPPLSASPIEVRRFRFGAQFNGQAGLEDNKTNLKGGQGQEVDGLQCYGPLNQTTFSEIYHAHTHLAIYRDGVRLAVPQLVGVVGDDAVFSSTCFYPLHTHDTSGTLHVEPANYARMTLGQFFDVWGQPLTRANVAGVPNDTVTIYVNDGGNVRKFQGDPRDIELRSYRSIVIELGAPLTEVPTFNLADEAQ